MYSVNPAGNATSLVQHAQDNLTRIQVSGIAVSVGMGVMLQGTGSDSVTYVAAALVTDCTAYKDQESNSDTGSVGIASYVMSM